MDPDTIYKQVKAEFADEWSRNTVEGLLKTNTYPRALEEFALYEHYLPRGEPILEAGCGLGTKLIYFREKGHRIVGVDFIQSALSRLKHYAPASLLSCCDIHHCPFGDDTFGAYLSYGVVEHFPNGAGEALREAYRILKKGGILVILVPAENFLSRFIHDPDNFLQRLKRIPWIRKIAGKAPVGPAHVHDLYMKLHTRQEMRGMLEQAGFDILLEKPVSHSFSLYMLCECFHADSHGTTNAAAEMLARIMKKAAPWGTANHLMFVGKK